MFFNSGIRGARARDGVGSIASKDQYVQKIEPVPSITSWAIQGSDDQALNPAGGQTVVVTGTGFAAGLTGIVGGTNLASVTVVSPYQATFTSPAAAPGSYTLILSNSSGTAAIYIPGLTYSSVPTYTTAAGSIGTYYETTAVSTQVVATSDSAMTYSLASGALPSGTTLYANGVITGSAPVDSSSTTYSFAITATDVELQDVTRSFTLTINTDVVTWSSPTSGTVYNVVGNTPISNVTLSATSAAGYGVTYAANALPAGLTLSSGVISGTPTTEANTTSLLTATAATTNRSATNTIYWVVTLNDSFFKYNSLLMSSTVVTNTFATDLSSNNFDITIVGDTKPSKFDPFELGYYSIYSPTVNDYYSYSDTSSGNFGTGDFTVEGWFYFTATAHNIIMPSSSTSTWGFLTYGDQLYWQENGGNYGGVGYGTVPKNQWVHLAVSRTGGFLTAYINGTRVLNSANTYNYSGTPTRYIGPATGGTNSPFWLSNIRYIKGTGIYSGTTFTVPTSPLTAVSNTSLLICQSNRMIDNSVNAVTFTKQGSPTINSFQPFTPNSSYATYGSTYFDGTGDYLSATPTSGLTLTGNFTIEFWVYFISLDTAERIPVNCWNTGSGWLISTQSNAWNFKSNGSFVLTYSSVAPAAGQWYHVAVTRSGSSTNNIKMFINGAQVTQGTSTNTLSPALSSGGLIIGAGADGAGQLITGYISNLRIVNGTAVYTSAFTPPTTPLTAITNTQLLTCQTVVPQTTSVFVDESSANNSITRNGNTNIGTFSPLSGSWSSYMTSSTTVAPTTNAAFTWGTGNYTIEMWYNPSSSYAAANAYLFDQGTNNTRVQLYNNYVRFFYNNGATELTSTTAGLGITGGIWYHLAIVRNSGVITMYINGTACGTVSSSANETSTSMNIGNYGGGGIGFNGYMSNFRAVKGTAVYTSNFTPSTTPLNAIAGTSILTFQSNRYVDYSPNNFALTLSGTPQIQTYSPFPGYITNFASYSGFFDGTGDYLSVPYNVALNLSTGAPDWTVEAWYNIPALIGSSQCIISKDWQAGSTNASYALALQQNGQFFYFFGNGTNASYSQQYSYTIPGGGLGAWHHVAMARSGSNVLCFFDGTLVQTIAITGTMVDAGNPVFIGMTQNSSEVLTNGYVSNARIVKGTAVYTATFTPPTAPLTAISGTSLLTCQSTTFIDNSANAFTITVAGNTKPMIQNPFTNTFTSPVAYSPTTTGSSMYFDGTGDYLATTGSTAYTFGTGDFTVELWVYLTTLGSSYRQFAGTATSSAGFAFGLGGSNKLYITTSTNGTESSGTALVAGQWYHCAWTRSSGTVRMFLNGVLDNTTAGLTTNITETGGLIGGQASNYFMNGYISNHRVVKGTALYTNSFVPSNSPLPAVQNTTLLVSSTITPSVYDAAEINDIENVGNSKLTASNSPYYSSYSGQFDGTGDYLSVASNAAFAVGTGDFTVEFWAYWTIAPASTTPGNIFYAAPYGTTGTGTYLAVYIISNSIELARYNTAADLTASTTESVGSWNHYAITRNNGTAYIFKNGVLLNSGAVSTSYTQAGITIGGQSAQGHTGGYISNFRLVKGTAVYTSAFTPPTAPLAAISGTSLLTCQSNRFIDNSTNAFTVTKVGDTKISAFQPFVGSNLTKYSSAYFGTKTDYLGMRPQPGLVTFPGDFTFECWVYPTDTTLSTAWGVWDSRQTGATAGAMIFFLIALASPVTGSWRLSYYNGTRYDGTGTVLYNQWTHVAWVRSGTTMTFYVNGVAGGTSTVTGTQTAAATTNPIYIGTKDNASAGYGTVGYIADLRITNGYARYTTTFTPPTVPLLGF